ncbi:MAG: hypothetical protein ACKO5K_00205 [Armatimonadota bacterium]
MEALPTDRDLVDAWIAAGISACFTVPCSITSTWAHHAESAGSAGRWWFQPTNHEGNLPGLAAGWWLGTGRPALMHLQNSGLANAGDGLVSLLSSEVCDIPAALLVTYRGADDRDDSEPHQAIGRRTDALIDALLGGDAVVCGRRDGRGLGGALALAARRASEGARSVLAVAEGSFLRTPPPFEPAGEPHHPPPTNIGCPDVSPAAPTRDAAIEAIVAAHPDAAILWSNGYTARAARAVADRPGNFYNVGYMGGTLAIGWALAKARPDLPVVVVEGDQNAQMGAMAPHVAQGLPENLRWIVLDNGVGASVGGPRSLPLPDSVVALATVVAMLPDRPGGFVHPRVGADGAEFPEVPPAGIAGLPALTWRFRRWVEGTRGARENTRS